jgi:IMP dehydrogenase
VLIRTKVSRIYSRSDVDTTTHLVENSKMSYELDLNTPIIAAPMDTVVSLDLVQEMYQEGGYAIWPRFGSMEDSKKFLVRRWANPPMRAVQPGFPTACSVGQLETDEEQDRIRELIQLGCEVVLVDVAHGGGIGCRRATSWLKENTAVKVIAGNISSASEARELLDCGADILRVGIGSGAFCETRIRTGCGMPTFQSILDIRATYPSAKLIADGGIKNSGDIVKALAAGADAVMLGRILAGTAEAPGEIYMDDAGRFYKKGRGMASAAAKQEAGMAIKHIEGTSGSIPYLGTVKEVLDSLMEGVRSGMSYVGAHNLRELREKAEFMLVSPAGQRENGPHSLLKLD